MLINISLYREDIDTILYWAQIKIFEAAGDDDDRDVIKRLAEAIGREAKFSEDQFGLLQDFSLAEKTEG